MAVTISSNERGMKTDDDTIGQTIMWATPKDQVESASSGEPGKETST
jgi:hypothetical protein